MDEKLLNHVSAYYPIYKYVGSSSVPIEDIEEYLKKNGVARTTAKRQIDSVVKDYTGLFRCNGNLIDIDPEKALIFVGDVENEFSAVTGSKETIASFVSKLKKENEDLKVQIKKLEADYETLAHKRKIATEVKARNIVAAKQVFPKVLRIDSVEVEEVEPWGNGVKFANDQAVLDLNAYIRNHGLETESFYMELPKDRELTPESHKKKLFFNIFTENRFLKRLRETTQVKESLSEPTSFTEEMVRKLNVTNDEATLQQSFLKGRAISVQEILEDKNLSNQEKLALYAFNSPYRRTDMEKLLNYAGDYCINANWLILLLESPDLCSNYENVLNLLRQCAKPSEYLMMQRLAEDLLQGKWFITADYKGKKTKFQLVPVDELNEIRKTLGLAESDFSYSKDGNEIPVKPQKSVPKEKKKPEPKKPVKAKEVKIVPEPDEEVLPDEVADAYEDKEEV